MEKRLCIIKGMKIALIRKNKKKLFYLHEIQIILKTWQN